MRRISLLWLTLGLTVVAQASPPQQPNRKPAEPKTEGAFVVHEWGTFLSVQGSDGVSIGGMVESEDQLPKFVIGRGPDGWERAQARNVRVVFSKMETPVTYFYTDRSRVVQFKAKMPKGLLTHWYPTVYEMKPAWKKEEVVDPSKGSTLDWGPFRVDPVSVFAAKKQTPPLPKVPDGDTWQSIRQPDSAIVSLSTGRGQPQLATEAEKFLFYRGLGSFDLPLHIQSRGKDSALLLKLQNQGNQSLGGVFLIWVADNQARWASLGDVGSLSHREIDVERVLGAPVPLADAVPLAKQAVSRALVSTGLFPKEASAMVDHWEKSYFANPGLRVLYLLPRDQTDAHIPIEVKPQPTEIVRTMVGRVEILTPDTEQHALCVIESLASQDPQSPAQAEKYLAGFGRFREALLRRVSAMNTSAQIKQTAEKLLLQHVAVPIAATGPIHDRSGRIDAFDFVHEAVKQGLKNDGVSPEVTKKLARRGSKNFLPKCRTCSAVAKALEEYGQGEKPLAGPDPGEKGLSRLDSEDLETRHAALKELVHKYVQMHFDRGELNPVQRRAIESCLEQERKAMSGVLAGSNSGQPYCPSCEGSCGIQNK
jgi:hypothetical protein